MNACFDEFWELFYTAVNTCNTGIKYVEAAPAVILSEADKNAYLGELKALGHSITGIWLKHGVRYRLTVNLLTVSQQLHTAILKKMFMLLCWRISMRRL